MSSVAAELLIQAEAKRLRLPVMASQAVRFAEEAALAGHGSLEFLAALLTAEVEQRDRNVERARVAKAKFPELKEISDFNFALVPSLNAPMIAALAKGAFIDRHEVILAVGPPGTGKTHIASGIGLEACRQGRRVRFVTVAELVMELSEAQAEHRLSRLETQLDRLDLLICDELGFIRLDSDQAQLLFILLAHRYTRGGLIIYVIWNLAVVALSSEEGVWGRNASLWNLGRLGINQTTPRELSQPNAGRCSRSIPTQWSGCRSKQIWAWPPARWRRTDAVWSTTWGYAAGKGSTL